MRPLTLSLVVAVASLCGGASALAAAPDLPPCAVMPPQPVPYAELDNFIQQSCSASNASATVGGRHHHHRGMRHHHHRGHPRAG